MLIQLKSLFGTLLLPLSSLLTLALIGLALTQNAQGAGQVLVGLSLASLWLLSTPAVALAIYRFAEKYPALSLESPIAADAIVVLGCDRSWDDSPEWGGPAVTDIAWDRLAYAAALARQTGLPVAITGTDAEARSMRNILKTAFGIEPRWVDSDASDTWGNAQMVARMLHSVRVSRIVLVTHSSHMGRAVDEFVAAGFRVVPAPVVVKPHSSKGIEAWLPRVDCLRYTHLGLHELIGRPLSTALRRLRH